MVWVALATCRMTRIGVRPVAGAAVLIDLQGVAWLAARVAVPRWRDAALAPRPPPMVGDIPPCPRVVSRATLPGPVAASRSL